MSGDNEKGLTLLKIDSLLAEIVVEMKGCAPASFATEIKKIEKIRQLLVYLCDLTTFRPSLLNTTGPKTTCKNAIFEAKQAMIDLGMVESDVDHILVEILARNIQIHFPIIPE